MLNQININKENAVQNGSEYLMARKDISFRTITGETVTVEKDVVFSVESDYLPDARIYNVTLKNYEISLTFNEYTGNINNDSSLAVQNKFHLKINESDYLMMINDFRINTFKMSKSVLEDSLMKDNRIINYHSSVTLLIQERRKMENEAEEIKHMLESDVFSKEEHRIKQFFNDIIDAFKKLEETPRSSFLIQLCSFTVSFLLFIRVVVFMYDNHSAFSSLKLLITVLITLIGFLIAVMKLSRTAEFFRDLLMLPLSVAKKIMSIVNTRMTYLYQENDRIKQQLYLNEERRKDLKKQINAEFPEIIKSIMSGNMLPDDIIAEPFELTGFSNQRINAADIQETETRTDEEIRGGYDRVAYPVYKTAEEPSPESAASGRHVISLTKPEDENT